MGEFLGLKVHKIEWFQRKKKQKTRNMEKKKKGRKRREEKERKRKRDSLDPGRSGISHFEEDFLKI